MKSKILRCLSCLFVTFFFLGIHGVEAQIDPTMLFAKGIGNEYIGGGDLLAQSIKIDASGNRYVAGYFANTADFDPSAATVNLTSAGGSDIFLAKYDASGNYVWAKAIGGVSAELCTSLALDGSGNVVMTGYFSGTADFDPGSGTANLSSAGNADIFLAKYDASGNYIWAKKIGGSGIDQNSFLALDGSGNVVVTGYFSGTADFDPGTGTANLISAGFSDIFIAKYDASGNYTWAKKIGGTGNDGGTSLALDASGNVVVTGYFNTTADFDPSTTGTASLTSAGNFDIFLAKYDASGIYVWAKKVGSVNGDFGNSLALDGSGNVVLTGFFDGAVDFDPSASIATLSSAGATDIFLAKYNSSGNYIWAKKIGGTGFDSGTFLALDGSGNVGVTGYFNGTADFDPGTGTANLTSAGGNDIFLAKYDASGNYIWAKAMGGTGADQGNSLALDGSSDVVMVGYFTDVADFDPGANTANLVSGSTVKNGFIASYTAANGTYNSALLLGRHSAKTDLISRAIVKDGSGNVVVTGYFNGTADFDPGASTANLTSAGQNDIFLAKYDASGNYIWAKAMGGIGIDLGTSLALDGNGNVVLTGYFNGTADFDPSAATTTLTSAGSSDIFLAKYDASGNYVWAKAMGGTGADQSTSIALDGSANVLLTGYFSATADFDPSTTTTNLVSAGATDIFLAKYDVSGNYIWAKKIGGASFDAANSLALDGSGNVVLTGYFNGTADFDPSASTANLTSAGGDDIFLAKYDASGNYKWAKAMGEIDSDQGISLALDGNGNVVLTGNFVGTVDFDPGAGTAYLSPGDFDIFLAKYDASGNYVWAKAMGGLDIDGVSSLALDGSGNVVLTGYFAGTAVFDPSASTANLTSAGLDDIFLAKYDASGNYVWAKALGGTDADYATSLALDGSGNVMLTGKFNGTADFDPSAGTYNLTSMSGGSYGFIAAYGNPACINPTAAGTIAAAQSGINPFTPAAFTSSVSASGQTGTVEYKWQSSTTSNSAGFADIASSNAATYTAGALTVTTWFKRLARVDCKNDWTGAVESNVLEITVTNCINPTVGGTIAAAQSGINPFTPAAFTSSVAASGQTGTVEYKWQSSTTSNSAGFADIASSNSATYTAGALTVTTWFKRLARVDCKNDWTGAVESNVLEVTVTNCINPTVGGTIAAAQSGINPFTPAAFTSSVAASGQTGTVEYKWQSSTTSNSAGFADIATSNAATYTAGALTVTTWFKRLARVDCKNDWTGAVESNVLAVTVTNCINPTVGGTIAAAQSGINPFTPAAFTSSVAASGQTGTLEYKWQSSTTSNSAGFADIASSNSATYTAGALTVTTWFKRLARVSCSADWTGAVESNVLEVTVTAACTNPTVGGTIAAAQSGTNPFNPAAFTSSVAASGETGTLEYKWQSSTTSSSAGFSDIASSNATTYDAGALTVTTWFKRLARVTCSADWAGAAASNVLEITISAAQTNGPVCDTYTNQTTANGLAGNTVNGVYASGSTVYVATTAGGLSISTDGGTTFTNKTFSDGLGNNTVRGVYASGSTVYAATSSGLSISTDGGATFTNKTTSNGLGSSIVQGVYAIGSSVYAATSGGLSISTDGGATFTNKTTANGLGSNTVRGVHVIGSIVHVATTGGLSISTDGGATFTNSTTTNGLGGNVVFGVYAYGSTVYAATSGGLSISTDGGVTFTNRTTANGLAVDAVQSVYASGSTVYAATGGGLGISTDGGTTFINMTTTNGLGTNVVKSVYATGSTIYAGTDGGLSFCSPQACTPPTSGGTIATAQSGTSPFNPAAFTSSAAASGETGTLEYKWQSSTTSNSTGFSDIASSNAATYDAGALTATTWFKRLARVTCSANWSGAPESNVLEVTVNAINTWVGGTDNFNVPSNWSLGTVPQTNENMLINSGNSKLDMNFTVGGTMTISGTGSLTINPGKTLSISGTADFGGKAVTVKSDATGTGSIGQITGTLTGASNVTVERYINTNKRAWRLLTIPVTGQSIRDYWAGTAANPAAPAGENPGSGTLITGHGYATGAEAAAAGFDWFTGLGTSTTSSISYYANDTWNSATNTPDILSAPTKQGYLLYVRGDRTVANAVNSGNTTLRPTGTLKTGDQNIPVSNTYEVVGNPYASNIDLDAVYNNGTNNAKIERNFWLWDATQGGYGGFRSLSWDGSSAYDMSGGSGNAADYLQVQSGQAFFVQTKSPGSISISESNKISGISLPPVFFASSINGTIGKINANLYTSTAGSTAIDGVTVRLNNDYDRSPFEPYDAPKLNNLNENLSIVRDGRYLGIESRPYPTATDTIYLSFWNLAIRDYVLKIKGADLGIQLQSAILIDRYTQQSTALNLTGTSNDYGFSITANANSSRADRFIIVLKTSTVLPLSITKLAVQAKTSGIELSWQTMNEINVRDFDVERSTDGISFKKIGNVTAANGTAVNEYQLLDNQPATGWNYYRLRSNDANGQYSYSATVKALWKSSASIRFYPTITKDGKLQMELQNQPAGAYKVLLSNIAGQDMHRKALTHAGATGTYSLQLQQGAKKLAAGEYVISVYLGNTIVGTQKMIIQ